MPSFGLSIFKVLHPFLSVHMLSCINQECEGNGLMEFQAFLNVGELELKHISYQLHCKSVILKQTFNIWLTATGL